MFQVLSPTKINYQIFLKINFRANTGIAYLDKNYYISIGALCLAPNFRGYNETYRYTKSSHVGRRKGYFERAQFNDKQG